MPTAHRTIISPATAESGILKMKQEALSLPHSQQAGAGFERQKRFSLSDQPTGDRERFLPVGDERTSCYRISAD